MKQLIVNGQSLDISQDEVIAMTLQVNNIAELKNRQSNISNEIKIPLTNRNKIILGNPDIASSFSQKTYKLLPATLIDDGVYIVPSGSVVVEEINDNTASLTLYSGIFDFFEIIKTKTLADLNLTEFDHSWNALTAYQSRNNITGYIYPILQTGGVPKIGNLFKIDYQVPSIFFHNIIDKIFIESGFKKIGKILTDKFYKSLIVQCNGDLNYSEDFLKQRSATVGMTEVLFHKVGTSIGVEGDWGPFVIPFNNENNITNYNNRLFQGEQRTKYFDGSLNTFDTNTYTWTAPGSFAVKFNIRVPFRLKNISSFGSEIKITLIKNGVVFANSASNYTGNNNPIEAFLQIEISDFSILGDKYWVTFELNELSNLTTYDITVPYPSGGGVNLNSDNVYFKVVLDDKILLNQVLPVANLLPDMKQSDFIKAWAHMFGIIFNSDPITNIINCVQFKEIPESEAQDWSSKLDLSKGINISFRFNDYGQKNTMKYAEGEETEKKDLGIGSFPIDDETLEKEVTVIELPFQGSDQTTVLDGINTASVPLYIQDQILLTLYERQQIKPRIFAIKKLENRYIEYTDSINGSVIGTPTSHSVAYFDEPGQPDSLSFEGGLIDKNYTELKEALNKCKIVKAYFNLSKSDIQNLDFFRKVYVEYFNLMFYVNVVNQYQSGKSTLVELVKI